jgi:hypothetical protein
MNGGKRLGILKVGAIAGLVGGLMLGGALAAGATIPPPGVTTTQGSFEFRDVAGYTPAGSGANCGAYASGASFGFNVAVWNSSAEAKDQAFNLQVFKMADLFPGTCYTEAQLAAMVHNGQSATETLSSSTDTAPIHFAAKGGAQVSVSATGLCGYYQFDMGLAGSGSFAPAVGVASPPVSGFVLFNGANCQQVASVTVTPSPTPVTTTATTNHTTGSGTGAGTLANTGGGPAPIAPYVALLALGLVSMIGGARLLTRRRLDR